MLSSSRAAGDTYKLANQVLIPSRFTPISPHPATNTLIHPLIPEDKSSQSSYSPFVVSLDTERNSKNQRHGFVDSRQEESFVEILHLVSLKPSGLSEN